MTKHAVVIAGGGPTGMMLGAELKLAGVDVAIVERRPTAELVGGRARGLHARTIEVFDMRGIADRFLAEGYTAQVAGFAGTPLDISEFPTRHNYGLALTQQHIERIMDEWITELGVTIYRSREVTGFTQDDEGVDVAISSGDTIHAEFLVACDGGRSIIRRLAGIEFPGWEPTMSWMIAEVHMTEEPKWGFHEDALGIHAIGKAEGGAAGIVLVEKELEHANEPTLHDLRAALISVYGTDFGAHSPVWISRFTDTARQAAAYRNKRVFLAGDAAHIHPPIGGQGLGIGVQDAVNLGWKLAQLVKGISPDTLLDTYQAERHPIGARVLLNTMAQVALRRTDERTKALNTIVSELLKMDEPRRTLGAEMSGLGSHYDLDEAHPLIGRRMPDVDVVTANGASRVVSLLHAARPLLISFGPGTIDIAPWADRVQLINARYEGTWELPVIGVVSAPAAVLVRPDGYVAWAGEGNDAGLIDALTRWFGPAHT